MTSSSQTFPLEIIEEPDMPPATDQAIRELLCECFTDESERAVFSKTRYWHGSAPAYTLIYRKDNRVLGHVGVVIREIRCADTPVKVAGIQNLAVAREMRTTKISLQLMREAMEEASKRGVRFGLLFCVPKLERFYKWLKWKTIARTPTMIDQDGSTAAIPGKNITMIIELTDEKFPEGNIHLQGPDW